MYPGNVLDLFFHATKPSNGWKNFKAPFGLLKDVVNTNHGNAKRLSFMVPGRSSCEVHRFDEPNLRSYRCMNAEV